METLKINYDKIGAINPIIEKQKDNVKSGVNETLAQNTFSEAVLAYYLLGKKRINEIAKLENNQLSNENEVNSTEAQLATLFGGNTYEKMLKLNNNKKQPLTMESVLSRFDVLQAA